MEIYLHVPYCRQKCRYCDFASFPHAESTQRAYVDAVLTEAASQAAKIPHGAMETAYLGGGTPSILPPELLTRLLEGVAAHFPLAPGVEFTSEANPGTLTHAWLDAALNCGINRLSMGMQAAQPALLKMLGRIHDFTQVQQSVELARHAGFQHISLDLMFGLPGQTVSMWRETLEKALSLNPEHLSCYGLIPEEGTPLYRDLQTGQLTLPDEDDERRMYDLTLDLLAQSGFQQYEISNFARPGCDIRHLPPQHRLLAASAVYRTGRVGGVVSAREERDDSPDKPTHAARVSADGAVAGRFAAGAGVRLKNRRSV